MANVSPVHNEGQDYSSIYLNFTLFTLHLPRARLTNSKLGKCKSSIHAELTRPQFILIFLLFLNDTHESKKIEVLGKKDVKVKK